MKILSLGSRLAALILLAGLGACAVYTPPAALVGQSAQQVKAVMGPPTVEMADRLVYARGPMGEHTWFVWLGQDGRVQALEQRLREDLFAQVLPGMSREDVVHWIGPPGERWGLARGRGEVWSWRYENHQCQWFQVEIDAQGRVRNAGYGIRPECEKPDWELP